MMYIAFTGNSAYCFSNSLHMCLQQAGMSHLPQVGLIECMTGMPFGASFLKFEAPLFFPNPVTIDPDSGLSRALDILGWTAEIWRGDDSEAALNALKEALKTGPVLVGPLDMGFLPYDPNHSFKRGGDHFVVALKMEGDFVQVHDPQLYPFVRVSVTDLLRAWYAKKLGYPTHAYTMRYEFREQRSLSNEEMLLATLQSAQELIHATSTVPVMYGGAVAFKMAADILQNHPSQAFAGLLTHFALPLGARRCLDAANFFTQVDKPDVARLMVEKAEAFGQAQYEASQGNWEATADLFSYLAEVETRIQQCV
jgi:hypothetical protein